MKVEKVEDCVETSPPCTAFVVLSERESDNAMIAEWVDLPGASRFDPKMIGLDGATPDKLQEAVRMSRTNRISVMSLSAQFDLPQVKPENVERIIIHVQNLFNVDRDTLLNTAFYVRCYHF